MRRLGPLLLLPLLFIACSQAPPWSFRLRDPIPVGPYTVSVTGSDAMNAGDHALLTVHFRLEYSTSPPDVMPFMENVKFSLRDSEGKKYEGFPTPELKAGTDPLTMFTAWRKRARNPEEMITNFGMDLGRWAGMFSVPASAHGFTLYLENRRPAAGQPEVAAVELGR